MSTTNDASEGRRPRVTIGVPVYNGERYLEETLESILDQTFVDFDVVISDNASTDGTREICSSFVERDSRFHYFPQHENRGGSWNFNEVVRLATGEYFKWAAHDDLVEPTFLERCVETLDDASGDVVLCYAKTSLIDAEGDFIAEYEDRLDIREAEPSNRYRSYLKRYELSNALHGLHRTEMLRKTRLLGNYHSSDLVLLSEVVFLGQIWEIPDRLFQRRWHDGMSRLANVTDAEVTAWFDPKKSNTRVMPRTRLFGENIRSIFTMAMPLSERFKCVAVLMVEWIPRYWRVVGGEFKREIKGLARRRTGDTGQA